MENLLNMFSRKVTLNFFSTSALLFVVSCTGFVQDNSKRKANADYSELGDQIVDESQNPSVTELPFKVNVPEGDSLDDVQAWAESSDTSRVPNPTVTLDASNSQFKVKITPVAGAEGEVTIKVYVKRRASVREHSFLFTIQPVNDPPVLEEFIAQTIPQNSSLSGVSFEVSDEETADLSQLILTAASNNQTLVPNANITLGGSGGNRTLGVNPVAGQSGTAIITVRATDLGGEFSEQSFTITVEAPVVPPGPNTAPVISVISDRTILEDATATSIPFTVVDSEQAATALTVTATSSNTSLIPNANLVLSGTGTSRSIDVSNALNQNGGPATITVTVSDGLLTATETFDVTVTAVNDSPTISNIANQTVIEDGTTGALAFTVGDIETAAASLTLTATSNNQTLVPDANISLGGSGASRLVSVTPAANEFGTATITVTVSDGALTSNDTFVVTVTSVNDLPTISNIVNQTVDEDVSTGALSFTITDVETPVSSLSMSGTSDNTTLLPNANIVFGGTGGSRTVTLTPAAHQFGTATITVTVNDGAGTASDLITLTVTSVPDAPVISDIASLSIAEDADTGALAFTISDAETASSSLSVSGTSSNQTLVPNGNIVFGGSAGNRTVTVTPAANQFGTATITVTVSDGSLSSTDTFDLVVSSVNDLPTISDISDAGIDEDTNTGAISFTVGDVETAAASLTLSGTSSNQTIVPNANIIFGGSGASRTVTVTPAANMYGTVTITVQVNDGSGNSTDSFVLTVTNIDDAPTISDIANQSTNEDVSTGNISFSVNDLETALGSLVITATSSNQTLVPNANITLGGSLGSRTLNILPAANESGTATITVNVNDGALSASDTFVLTVGGVNDAPTISDISNSTVNEDTATSAISFTVGDAESGAGTLTVSGISANQTIIPDANIVFGGSGASRTVTITPASNQNGAVVITISVSDGTDTTSDTFTLTVNAVNDAPTISDVADTSTNEDTATSALAVSISDVETAASSLVLTATSSNQTIVPDGNISLGGSGGSRTVTITPASNQNGTATITLSVSDGAATSTDTFVLTVDAVNDAPTISDIADQTVAEDTATSAMAFTIGDAETAAGSLTVSGTSSNQTLVPDSNIVFGGSGANRTVTVTPALNQSGTATITVQVSDGSQSVTDTFVLTVSAVNDAPTITDIANQTTNEDTATGALAFTIGDPETAAASLTLTGTSSNQTFVPDANIVFGGSGANRTVTITPALNQSGTVTITVQVSDGSATASDTFTLTIDPVNDAPTISDVANQTTNEDTATSALAVTIGDVETATSSLTVTGTSSNQTLVPNANIVWGGSGANRTVTLTPASNQSGTVTITLEVSDGTSASTDTFTLTVNAVNDAPTISDVANQSTNEDTATSAIAVTVGDVETGAGSLTLTGTSSNQTLLPDANIVFGGSGSSRTVTLTPALNASGTVTLTLDINDGAQSSTDTFVLTVNAVNDVPTISDIGNQSTDEDTATGSISVTIADVETAAGSLTLSATSSDQTLVPNGNITLGGSGGSRTVNILPASNQTGSATITVQVSDGSASATDTFVLTVGAVNDDPSISDVANQSTNEDTATSAIAITVGDAETAAASLTMSGSSSNQTIVPDANIVFGGSGANRTVTITPASNQNGTVTITISVSDGVATTSDTFTLTINAVNDAPTISDVANSSTNEDTATSAIAITVGDVETSAASLTMSGSSSDTNLVPNGNIVFGGSGASRTVTITPASNLSGSSTITLTVSDGSLTATDTFVLTVNAVNDAPTISDVTNKTTNEDTATSAIAITIGDNETAAGSLTMSGSSSNTSVVPNGNIVFGGSGTSRTVTITPAANASGTSTITLTVNDGTTTASDTFVLTVNAVDDSPTFTPISALTIDEDEAIVKLVVEVQDIDSAASGLTFSFSSTNAGLFDHRNAVFTDLSDGTYWLDISPEPEQSGTTTIRLTDDATGAYVEFGVTVNNVNDAPTITDVTNKSTNEDTATSAIAFTIGDVETAVGSLSLTASSSNTTLVPNGNISLGGTGASRTVTLTPTANNSGTSTITLSVGDGVNTTTDTFVLTVNAVNDAPTITSISSQTIARNTNTGALSFTIGDVETAVGSLTLTGTSSNTTVIPNANIVFGGSGASRTVTVTPATNKFGLVTITVGVGDGSTTTNGAFNVTVSEPMIETARVVITYPHKDGFKVSKKDKSAFQVSGTCTIGGGNDFQLTDDKGYNDINPVCNSGVWSATLNFSAAADGEQITIQADPTNNMVTTSRSRIVTVDDAYCDSTKEAASPFAAGAGTVGDPYMICTATQLDAISDFTTAYYQLKNTINLADLGGNWSPIFFHGNFNGNNFQIKNMTVNNTSEAGLFKISTATNLTTIQNLHLYNPSVTTTAVGAGTIISGAWGMAHSLSNVSSHGGTVTSTNYGVGGIAGVLFSGATITDAYSSTAVSSSETGTGQVGGIVGRASDFTLTRVQFAGTVTGRLSLGGLVGAGWGSNNNIVDSFSTGTVTGQSGDTGVGGLAGQAWGGFSISNSYATGAVTGGASVAALSGNATSATITNSYATGLVTYSTSGEGLCINGGSNTVSSSYWDIQKTGRSSSACGGTGKTTAQFKDYTSGLPGMDIGDSTNKWNYNYSLHDGPVLRWYSLQHQ
jgi:VCBS repeat-containing protein